MNYIAYGSNLNLEQMAYRCPNSKPICKGKLFGWKLVFNTHLDILYTGDNGDVVPVLVWEIADDEWNSLDRYEGYPKYYVKKSIKTYLENGTTEDCVAYVMAENQKGIMRPFREYFDRVLDGYVENNMDEEYLWRALKYTFDNEDSDAE